MTASQKTYNFKLSSTRQVIERAFGLLKGAWRRLFYLDMLYQRKIVSVIVAACVLHNFCLGDINRLDNVGYDNINHEQRKQPASWWQKKCFERLFVIVRTTTKHKRVLQDNVTLIIIHVSECFQLQNE